MQWMCCTLCFHQKFMEKPSKQNSGKSQDSPKSYAHEKNGGQKSSGVIKYSPFAPTTAHRETILID